MKVSLALDLNKATSKLASKLFQKLESKLSPQTQSFLLEKVQALLSIVEDGTLEAKVEKENEENDGKA